MPGPKLRDSGYGVPGMDEAQDITFAQPGARGRRIDLNLVRVFVLLYETRSVSAAAERLFVTQPTVSHSLSRLRELFGNPLFIRSSVGMIPTVVGERVYREFSASLLHAEAALEIGDYFDPTKSSRRFQISISDIAELVFLPPLLLRLHESAPHVEIETRRVHVDDMEEALHSGNVDILIGSVPALRRCTQYRHLFSDRFVCLMRSDHPDISDSLNLEQFIAAKHIFVSSPFTGHRQVEAALRERNLHRKIALQIPQFIVLPKLLEQTDFLVTLPSRVARVFQQYADLKYFEIPLELSAFDVALHWHARYAENAANQWLRALAIETFAAL